ncbi:MAG: redoxin domain-containing protein [bacterium]|nr:redoxin domain-containing protein [bacterium]
MTTRIVPVFLLIALLAVASSAAEITPMEIGSKAIDFSLPGVDGKTYTLADFADAKLLVMIFTANHCPTAQAYEDRIIQLYQDYHDKGVAFVLIAPNDPHALRLDEMGYTDVGDTLDEMKLRARDKGFECPYLYAGDKPEWSQQYGPISTPHVFIFDAQRTLRYQGRIDDNEKPDRVTSHDARNAIDALLAGQTPAVQTTKTFGCSIKWPDKRHLVTEAFENWAKEKVELNAADVEKVKSLLNNESDQYLLVNVWATWCGPCVTEFPELVTINRMYRHRDFRMATISADPIENRDKALKFLTRNEASMENYIFQGKNNYELIEAVDPEWAGALPYTVLIKPGGEIIYRCMEAIDPLALKREIVKVLGRVYP